MHLTKHQATSRTHSKSHWTTAVILLATLNIFNTHQNVLRPPSQMYYSSQHLWNPPSASSNALLRPSIWWGDIYKYRMALWRQQVENHVPSTNYKPHNNQLYNGTCHTNVCRTFDSLGGFSMSKFSKFQCKCPEGKICKTFLDAHRREGLCVSPDYQNQYADVNETDLYPHMTRLLAGVP